MKDWTGTKTSIYAIIGASNHSKENREFLDYYATDPAAVEKLLEVETFNKNILEPCCGGGHISETLIKNGFNVESKDIVNRGYIKQFETWDYLTNNNIFNGDIITNPPYSLALEFVEHSLKIVNNGAKIAMFLKLTFLEGQKRKDFFKLFPPVRIHVFSKRLECGKNGEFTGISSAVCYAWFIWEKGNKEKPIINWL